MTVTLGSLTVYNSCLTYTVTYGCTGGWQSFFLDSFLPRKAHGPIQTGDGAWWPCYLFAGAQCTPVNGP